MGDSKKYIIGGFETKLSMPFYINGKLIKQGYRITLILYHDETRNSWEERDFFIVLKPRSRKLKPLCRALKNKCMTIKEIEEYFKSNSLPYDIRNASNELNKMMEWPNNFK